MIHKSIPVVLLFASILLNSCHKDEPPPVEPLRTEKEAVNVILLIGDGMGLGQITAARIVNHNLNLARFRDIGLVSTHSANNFVTESGAAATAYATGYKTNNNVLGLDPSGNVVTNITEIAEKNGLITGIITTTQITHATPGAFYAHQANRYENEKIALDLMNIDVDFFAGGGRIYFDQRSDGLNLIDTLTAKGYYIGGSLAEIQQVHSKKTGVFIADNQPLKYSEGRGNYLPDALREALDRFSTHKRGFFIMVEGGQIDWACEDNDEDYMIAEMLDFDRTVGVALDFAEKNQNTLVIVVGDHETGGYALTQGSYPEGVVNGEFTGIHHTGMLVPLFAYGYGSREFGGVMENNELFYKILSLYGFE